MTGGQSGTIIVTVQVPVDAISGSVLLNTGLINMSCADLTTGNNSASASTLVLGTGTTPTPPTPGGG